MHIVTYMVCGKHKSRSTFRISEEDGKTGTREFYLAPVLPSGEVKDRNYDYSNKLIFSERSICWIGI